MNKLARNDKKLHDATESLLRLLQYILNLSSKTDLAFAIQTPVSVT